LNLAIAALNFAFLINKNIKEDRILFLINGIYCVLSSLTLRFNGIRFVNNLGVDFSVFFIKNQVGSGITFDFDMFNAVVSLQFYDTSQLSGFFIGLNIIMISLGVCFFYSFKRSKHSIGTN
jgi:hypothetical protein